MSFEAIRLWLLAIWLDWKDPLWTPEDDDWEHSYPQGG